MDQVIENYTDRPESEISSSYQGRNNMKAAGRQHDLKQNKMNHRR